MKLKKILLFTLLWPVFTYKGFAQQEDISFTSLTTKEGLSSNSVNAILRDHLGVMWFATEDGLDKFDGVKFTVYRQNTGDTTSLRSNEILALHEDRKGNLWIGTSGGSLSLYDRKRDAFINFPAKDAPNFLRNNVILGICSDYTGKLWIAHYTGIDILDPETRKISRPSFSFPNPGPYNVVFEDSRHMMWLGTNNGLYQYDPAGRKLKLYLHAEQNPNSLRHNHVTTIAEDHRGNIWVGTVGGLSRLDAATKEFSHYSVQGGQQNGLSSGPVNSIAVDGDKLWVATAEGLDILNIRTGDVTKLSLDYRNQHSLTARSVRCIYIDPRGIYWLGLFRGGVDRYDKNLNLFHYVQSNVFDEKGLNGSIVTSFAEDRSGKIYVGTEGPGLSLFDPATKAFQPFSLHSRRSNADNRLTILSMLMSSRHQLLIGTFSDGLFVFDPLSGQYRQLLKGTNAGDLNANDIFCITEDRKGNFWVGTNGDGINVLDPAFKVIARYTPTPSSPLDVRLPINGYIRDIREDRDGNCWIGTHGGGLAVLQPASGRFQFYSTRNSPLPDDKISSLAADKEGNMWIGTKGGGVSVFDRATRKFTTLSEKDGLQNTSVYKIIPDDRGLVWLSTNKGISSIDPHTRKISNYNYHNGIQNNNFVQGSGLRLSDGELYFGGLEGFNYFNPAYLKKNTNIPPVLITDLRISNQSVAPSEDGPIKENIAVAKEINLDYKQNFALQFVGLNYTAPEQNQYAYKLEGFDKDWNYVGNSTTAAYTNLDPGTYTFRVKASNNDLVWNKKGTSITIRVHPPFWRTIYAYIFYVLAFVGSLFYIRYRGIQKLKRKFALEQEKVQREQERKEAERVHELDRLKIRFLTNLSHEFRTPISLILGPADRLLQEQQGTPAASHLNLIKRNARRLLNLVNQLLDFRKMEEHELKLQASEGELVQFVKEVSDSFKDLSERKKIAFTFHSGIDKLYTVFDHDKIERILFNLLSNAFKFTLEGGRINLVLEQENALPDPAGTWVTLKVSDTGIGIPADQQEKIFERFFQHTTAAEILNQGTGIGLSITREFVKMHAGTIDVESEPGQGSTFIIRLPFTPRAAPSVYYIPLADAQAPLPPAEQAPALPEADTLVTLQDKKLEMPAILLVEDNDDFRFYLKDNLRMHYKVIEAADGKEGWQKALANHPALIVSDISMPSMTGIELCRKIKADKRTSHIPLILLTALAGEQDQLKGLETGATDYITKPFNFEVLIAKINNLLQLNQHLKNTYSRQIKVIAPEVKVESEDEKLLQTIMLYLEENLTNSQLSVEELSRHVGMSRSSLYSRLLEITGQTPVEYIRSVKLDKAAVLLEKSDMNIAQVAYSVGFATPNYFAKSFKAKFNMLPSEYLHKMRKGNSLN